MPCHAMLKIRRIKNKMQTCKEMLNKENTGEEGQELLCGEREERSERCISLLCVEKTIGSFISVSLKYLSFLVSMM
jgi:hypothetical protein